MLDQLSNAVRFYFAYTAAKVGKTGLTVTVDVYRGSTGALVETAQPAVEIAGGLYRYVLPGTDTGIESEYIAIAHTTDATVDQKDIFAIWVVGKAWLQSVASIGALSVTIVSPIATDGTITLVRGDDYFAADGMAIDFVFSGLPYSFVGSTSVKLSLKNKATGDIVTFTGAVLSATSLRFEPTKAVTSTLVPNTNAGFGPNAYTYDVEVILADGHTETPGIGKANVREGIS